MNLDNFPPVGGGRGLWHGGDYNPEQWPKEVWDEDARLMDQAHWNVVTLAVFSWVTLEPSEGVFNFGWLDEMMDRMHGEGRKVVLATSTAATPAWLDAKYPEILRTTVDRVPNLHSNRVNYCLTSPIYREKCRILVEEIARRYANHPALAMWHVSNEYGGCCYCDLCAEAFRDWLKVKFNNDLGALNAAYWTTFWSHTYTDWSQIEIPNAPKGESSIHGQTLDWNRFVTDQTISLYENETTIIRKHNPAVPVTTNFMGFYGGLDYQKFAKHVDVVSWDSYPGFTSSLSEHAAWLCASMTHDLNRSLKQGKPYLLMECTPSASNWYPSMELKRPGMHMLEGLQAIAHGSDSVQYFQWRMSRGSGEKFHGAVVQQDGTANTRVFRDVADLGVALEGLKDVTGSTTKAEVGLIYDWENAWSIETAAGPRQGGMGYSEAVQNHYLPFWQSGVSVDILSSDDDFDRYRLVVAPMLYMVKPGVAERIEKFVRAGGTFVATYHTGISDENDLCFPGYPGPLRSVLGIWNEEIDVLKDGKTNKIELVADNALGIRGSYHARTFCSVIHLEGAEAVAKYASDFYAGQPAVTLNRFGEGEAYYIASRNDAEFQAAFLGRLIHRLNLRRAIDAVLPTGVTAQRRQSETQEFVFLLNITGEDQHVSLDNSEWHDILAMGPAPEEAWLPPYGVKVLSRPLAKVDQKAPVSEAREG